MGLPETPSPPHLYPQALQLKLYQAFIFSIPILFSIILFLLFYLFYLKRRASSLTSPPILPTTSLNQPTSSFAQSPCEMGLKGKVIEKLPKVLFDEDLGARDSQCCVCLGEFEIKEELTQVPSCKHVFHVDCIRHWLRSNATCPLCRCSVISSTKLVNNNNPQPPPASAGSAEPLHQNTSQNPNSANADLLREEQVIIQVEGTSSSSSSSGSTCLRDSGRCIDLSLCIENNNVGNQDGQEVYLHIQTHNS